MIIVQPLCCEFVDKNGLGHENDSGRRKAAVDLLAD